MAMFALWTCRTQRPRRPEHTQLSPAGANGYCRRAMAYVTREAREELLGTIGDAIDELGRALGGRARGGAVPADASGLRSRQADLHRLRRPPRPGCRSRVRAGVAGRGVA